MNVIITWLCALLSPPQCAQCKIFISERDPLCASCESLIRPVTSIKIPLTARYSMTVHALADYQEPLRSLILAKNYGTRVGCSQLAQLIIKRLNISCIESCDYFVPVPLHWSRYAQRGFNQADIIATMMATAHHKKVAYVLKRHKKTLFQAALTALQRKENVAQSFSIKQLHDYEGKHLIIIDDLMTTGATLQAAAKELIKLKPASITAIVAARVVL